MFIVTSLFTLVAFLAGYAAVTPMKSRGVRLEEIALAIGTGLLIDHALMVCGLRIPYALTVMLLLALAGVWMAWRDLRALGSRRLPPAAVAGAACVIALCVIYYFRILFDPLVRWDARSVWFFHARMIWAADGVRASTGFGHPSVAFTSPDYPNLVPAVAAQLAYMRGFWNEFLPKASLVVMLLPLLLWVFSFVQLRLSFLLLVLLFFFSYNAWLWNGYMDAYLTMYAGVALLSIGRYLARGREVDLYSTLCALGIVAMMKNEGLLFAVTAGVALAAVAPWYDGFDFRRMWTRARLEPALVGAGLLLFAPVFMWAIATRAWGFQNALVGDASAGLSRAATRLADGSSPQIIFQYLFQRATAMPYIVTIVGVVAAACVWVRVRLPAGVLVAMLTALLYASGLFVIYSSTPIDLWVHLENSAGRTMATANMALFVALYFLLSSIESIPKAITINAETAERAKIS